MTSRVGQGAALASFVAIAAASGRREAPSAYPPISVDFGAGPNGLTGSVSVGGDVWWQHQPHTPLRLNGKVHWQGGGEGASGLLLDGTATTHGEDAFGTFTRMSHTWSVGATAAQQQVPVLETACRSYPTQGVAVFETVAKTNWTATNGSSGAAPMMQFPGLVLPAGSAANASYAMWYGLWPLPAVGLVANVDTALNWGRRHDGPLLLTGPDRTAVVVGPVNDTLNIVSVALPSFAFMVVTLQHLNRNCRILCSCSTLVCSSRALILCCCRACVSVWLRCCRCACVSV
jgi:hypothetical protein